MSFHLSHPETPLTVSARHEKRYVDQEFPNFKYDSKMARPRHLHFTWNPRKVVFNPFDHDGNLEEVKLGEARVSKEGVRYSQLYCPNPGEWAFEVDDEQFSEEILESREEDSEPQPALVAIPEFKIFIKGLDDLPDGALIENGSSGRIPHWKVVENPMGVMVVACKGQVEFGKPTISPPSQTLSRAVGSLRRVTGSVRRLGRKLTGKREEA